MTIRACVFGAGAIGGFLAASLSRGNTRLSLVARGAQLEAVRRHGITVHRPDGRAVQFDPDEASADPHDLGVQDVVFVTVKSTDLPALAGQIGPLLSPDTSVVFITNGIPWWYPGGLSGPVGALAADVFDPGSALHRAIDRRQVIGGVIYSACTMIEPGVIRSVNLMDKLVIGAVDDPGQERSAWLADLVTQGGLACEVTQDIRAAVWSKLLTNLASAPICLLSRSSISRSYADPVVRSAALRLVEEGRAIAAAVLGHPLPGGAEELIAKLAPLDHKPSILQDFERGRPMETEVLLTRPQQLARLAGVLTPVLDLLVALACQACGVQDGAAQACRVPDPQPVHAGWPIRQQAGSRGARLPPELWEQDR